ncbi:prolyl oligopeptidase family protein [Caulobacter sp. AP07]|nr:prolyl oligopeptidase family protein [Caulobacter sp. AP07]
MRAIWLLALLWLAPLQARAAPTVQDLIELTDLSGPAISPDGAWVAYRGGRADLRGNRYVLSWYVAPLDRPGRPRRVADGGYALWTASGTPVVEAPVWSADSRRLYFRALGEGGVQVWRTGLDSAPPEPVTHDQADVERYAIANGRLTYEVGPTRAEIRAAEADDYDNGVLIDETVDPAQSLFGAIDINGRLASQRFSGPWFGRAGRLGARPPQRRAIDLATLSPVDVQDPAAETATSVASHGVLVTQTPGEAGQGAIRMTVGNAVTTLEVQDAEGRWRTCQLQACRAGRVLAAAWRPGRPEVVFTVRDSDARYALWAWAPRSDAARRIAVIDGALGGGGSRQPCAVGARRAVCVVSEPLAPPRLEAFDLDGRARTVLDAPNADLAAPAGLMVERLSWTDDRGQTFLGRLVTAAGAPGRAPLFIHYYNCDGYLRGGTGDEWPFALIAQAGIAALCVNYPTPPSDRQDAVAEYDTAEHGLRAVIDLLDRRGLIDPKRVGMGGLSFGSEVAYWTAMKSDLLAAMSVTSVQLEPTYYWINGFRGRDVHDNLRKVWGLGAPDETPERWKLISPALNTGKIKAAVLMQMPEQEYRPTIELISRLSNTTTPFELHVFANEPHILVQPRHRQAAYVRNIDWFRFWLQGYVDPAPGKADQYRRWKALAARRDGAAGAP